MSSAPLYGMINSRSLGMRTRPRPADMVLMHKMLTPTVCNARRWRNTAYCTSAAMSSSTYAQGA